MSEALRNIAQQQRSARQQHSGLGRSRVEWCRRAKTTSRQVSHVARPLCDGRRSPSCRSPMMPPSPPHRSPPLRAPLPPLPPWLPSRQFLSRLARPPPPLPPPLLLTAAHPIPRRPRTASETSARRPLSILSARLPLKRPLHPLVSPSQRRAATTRRWPPPERPMSPAHLRPYPRQRTGTMLPLRARTGPPLRLQPPRPWLPLLWLPRPQPFRPSPQRQATRSSRPRHLS